VIEIFSNKYNTTSTSKILSVLIFLFPIAGMSVRHWYSTLVSLIILIGIYLIYCDIKNNVKFKKKYSRNEITLMGLIALLFVSYLISGFANGWDDNQLRYFSREMNFILFIPLYVAVRNIQNSIELIILGTLISSIVILFQFINDVYINPTPFSTVQGAYSHLLIGPVAIMSFFMTFSLYKYFPKEWTWKIALFVAMSLFFIGGAYSRSGTAYVLFAVMSLLAPLMIIRNTFIKLACVVLLVTLLFQLYLHSNTVKTGINRVLDSAEYTYQLSKDDLVKSDKQLGTLGDRIVLWMSAWEIFKDNVFFGIGRGNYNLHVREYYEKEKVHFEVITHGHPHSIYFETMASKGLVGLIVLGFIIFYVFRNYLFWRKHKLRFVDTALIHMLSITIIGIGASAPLIKNNFMAIFLCYLAIFFSSMEKEYRNNANK